MVIINSVWKDSCDFSQRDKLNQDIKTDVAVIGGGMAGILCAYMLKSQGVDVVLIEAKRITSGVTQNTTAKITSQHNLIYDKLINKFSIEQAQMYAKANEEAITQYQNIIQQNNIDCDFEIKPAYIYTLNDLEKIEIEVKAAQKLGINAEFTKETTLPFDVLGAVKFNNQAQFNPLKFLKGIVSDIPIYENTMATGIEDNIITTDGGKITANSIIVTTHYPFINAPGYYFVRMYQERSYVLALENAQQLDGMYIDESDDGFSFRNYKDLLLFGGAGHRTGKNREGGSYEKLRVAAKQYYPDSIEKYYWSAQDCVTLDSVPYIGEYSASTPNLYVATGFGKWGMTSSMVSANILTKIITKGDNPYREVFSPQRFDFTASAINILDNTTEIVSGFSSRLFGIPDTLTKDLPKGHGGIVEYEGEKLGVYKNDEDEIFVVSTKCRHMGCQLEWNPDELSWDCPCHGSRFDYKGQLINNPTLKDLEHK